MRRSRAIAFAAASALCATSARGVDPYVGAVYYPWYGNAYHSFSYSLRDHLVPRQGPLIGPYDSRISTTIGSHIDQSKRGGIDFWSMSWWGPGSNEDNTIRNYIFTHPRAAELKYAVYYETIGRLGSPSAPNYSNLTSDFVYLGSNVFSNPNYFRINGRPVVYLYASRGTTYFDTQAGRDAVANMRTAMKAQFGYDPYIVGDEFNHSNLTTRAKLWDAVHTYDVGGTFLGRNGGSTTAAVTDMNAFYASIRAQATAMGIGFVPSVMPGFNDRGWPGRISPRYPRYQTDVPGMIEGSLWQDELERGAVTRIDPAAANQLLAVTFNEWHEDTQIEATVGTLPQTSLDDSPTGSDYTGGITYRDYGYLYLDLLKQAKTSTQWLADASGNWSNSSNWIGTLPNVPGATASFKGAITAPRIVTLDISATSGTLNFANASSYTLAGTRTLTVDSSTSAGAINVTQGSHTIAAPLRLARNTTVSITAASSTLGIAGDLILPSSVALTKTGAGTLLLSTPPANYLGATTITGGAIAFAGNGDSLANSSVNIETTNALLLSGPPTVTLGAITGSGSVALGSSMLAVGALNSSTTYSGTFTGTGALTKVGNATLTLSAASTHTGSTNINGGRIVLASPLALQSSTVNISVHDGLDLNGHPAVTLGNLSGIGNLNLAQTHLTVGGNNSTATYSGALSGSGSFTKTGTGTLILTATSTFTGGTSIINSGTLGISMDAALGAPTAPLNINFSTLQITAALSSSRPITLSVQAGITTLTDTTLSGPITGSGVLNKNGAATLHLTSDNTHAQGTTINAGTIAIADNAALGAPAASLRFSAGTLLAQAPLLIDRTVSISGNSATIDTNGLDISFTGNINGSGFGGTHNLVKAGDGTLTLTGNNTYAGQTMLNRGVVSVSSSANLGNSIQPTNTIVFNGGTLRTTSPIDFARTASVNAAGGMFEPGAYNSSLNSLTGPGAFTKSGPGALTTGALDVGPLTVADGRLAISPARGLATVQSLSIASSAALDLTDNDLIVASAAFSDIRDLVFTGFGATRGITSSTSDGSQILALFDNASVGASSFQGRSLSPTSIVGVYTSFGDVNLDRIVTGDDYTVIDSNLNTQPLPGVAWISGDANLDGFVTGDDYTTIDSNLGRSVPGASSAIFPSNLLPEPALLVPLALAASLLPRIRRRTR